MIVTNKDIKILHIDDDKGILDVTATFCQLINPHLTFVQVSTFKEAFDIINTTKIDVIVSDYQLTSDINGLQLFDLLRKRNINLPFIMFTGKGREEIAMQALNAGVDCYIKKSMVEPPVLYGELVHYITQLVDNQRMKHELKHAKIELEQKETNSKPKIVLSLFQRYKEIWYSLIVSSILTTFDFIADFLLYSEKLTFEEYIFIHLNLFDLRTLEHTFFICVGLFIGYLFWLKQKRYLAVQSTISILCKENKHLKKTNKKLKDFVFFNKNRKPV